MRALWRAIISASRPRTEIFICILSHGKRDAEEAHPSKKIIINVAARRIRSGMVGTDKSLTSSLPRVEGGWKGLRGGRVPASISRDLMTDVRGDADERRSRTKGWRVGWRRVAIRSQLSHRMIHCLLWLMRGRLILNAGGYLLGVNRARWFN